MKNTYYITKLTNIIKRIFDSIQTPVDRDIEVLYLGKKCFSDTDIDQRCFQFKKNNSQFLNFELLIPSDDMQPHKLNLEALMEQIVYKYNIENIACFIHDPVEVDDDHMLGLCRDNIFEVTCISKGEKHKVYIDIDPEEFFD